MRRPIVLLITALLMLLLASPATALAGGPWVVKNAAGKGIGTAKSIYLAKYPADPSYPSNWRGRVYGGHRFKTAGVTYNRMFTWFTWCKGDGGKVPPATVGNDGSGPPVHWGIYRQGTDPWYWDHRGRIVKRHGRWVVEQRIAAGAWQKRGSVNDACPAWLAGGAVYLLVGPKWL